MKREHRHQISMASGAVILVILAWLTTVAPSADRILIGVSDTGPGIPQEAHSQVFEKFQQIESVRGRRVGTGLGLSFCKLVVEAHAGRIWVESEPTKGSTFLMTLPLSPNHSVRQPVSR